VLAVAILLIGLTVTGVFASKSGSPASKPSTTARTTSTASTQPNSASVRIPTTTLKPRDHGSQVKALQRALAALGYSGGRVDGSYGPATERALASFQRAHNLTADGIFGPATRTALSRAVRLSG
jgi:peptidoglycan hydrolase-like protein with peptidoglycan-binding domain